MKQQLFRNLLSLIYVAVILTGSIFAWIAYRHVNKEIFLDLQMDARLLEKTCYEQGLNIARLKNIQTENRVTVVDSKGSVIYDSYVDAQRLENHGNREEIAEARAKGSGFITRPSGTLGKEVLYYALALPDGSILRLAKTNEDAYSQFKEMVTGMVLILLLVLVAVFFAAKAITKRVLRPLEQLELEAPPKDVYPELKPIVESFSQQQQKLAREMVRYEKKKQELKTISNNMDEGLLLLDNEGMIITLNKSAVHFFGRQKQSILRHKVQEFGLAKEFDIILQQIEIVGKGSLLMQRGNNYYQLNASRVGEEGLVLLLMDVTERTAAENMRREFSANVSHELKTPLQSVLGYSEIMLSGLVREEDRNRFLQKIYDEAKNLLNLIDDIIKLSRLDELKQEMLEPISLKAIGAQVLQRLSHKAEQAQVTLELVQGEDKDFTILGIPSLMEEVLTNLVDNGIKYNRPGGRVTMTFVEKESKYQINIADTGVGIAAEEQCNIFQRFYRVDRSRHKAVDGTGLGLSIVKHGVQFHSGTIKVRSQLGQGSEFVLKFPKNLG